MHPLHVESVAWVAERKDVLSAFFFMRTIWAYAGYAKSKVGGDGSRVEDRGRGDEAAQSGIQSTKLSLRSPDPSGFKARGSRFPVLNFNLPSSIFYLLSLLFLACGLM